MTHYYREADIDVMLSDFGVPVEIVGVNTVRGIVDTPDELLLEHDGAGMIGVSISVLFKTSAVPSIIVGSQIRIDSRLYDVRQRLRQDEGAVTRVLCALGVDNGSGQVDS